MRRFLLAKTFSIMIATAAASDTVTFHFYGAEDCPPCMAFKRNNLADVQAQGASIGFVVEENVIPKTQDVPTEGVYGDRDAILRSAAPQLEVVYPPIFFVSAANKIVSVHGHDWASALVAAIDEAD
jgi:thiol-disulfide isomerase/thioredoxin